MNKARFSVILAPLRDHLVVGCDSLEVVTLVRIQVPQSFGKLRTGPLGRVLIFRRRTLSEQRIEGRMYFVYIIECSDGSLYTGMTRDVERRFNEHKNKKGGHYTSSKEVVKIVYIEEHPDRSSALKRESQIKGWTRQKKLNLIQFGHP